MKLANRLKLLMYCVEPSTQYVVSVRAINRFGKGLVVYDLVYTRDASSQSFISRSIRDCLVS